MTRDSEKPFVLVVVAVVTLAVIFVDEPAARSGLTLLLVLFLAQIALSSSDPAFEGRSVRQEERRVDGAARHRVEEVLKPTREFYAVCHATGEGRMEAGTARARAHVPERRLNRIMAELMDADETPTGIGVGRAG